LLHIFDVVPGPFRAKPPPSHRVSFLSCRLELLLSRLSLSGKCSFPGFRCFDKELEAIQVGPTNLLPPQTPPVDSSPPSSALLPVWPPLTAAQCCPRNFRSSEPTLAILSSILQCAPVVFSKNLAWYRCCFSWAECPLGFRSLIQDLFPRAILSYYHAPKKYICHSQVNFHACKDPIVPAFFP